MIGQIVFNSGGLGAKWNVSGKLDMKLAIVLWLQYNTSNPWVQIYTRHGAKSSILNCNPV